VLTSVTHVRTPNAARRHKSRVTTPTINYEHRAPQIIPLENGFRIELGPVSTQSFLITILPPAIFLVFCSAASILFAWRRDIFGVLCFPLLTLLSMYVLIRMSRHRNLHQQITVMDAELSYSGPSTAGLDIDVIHPISRFEVGRYLGVTWIWRLTVRPPKPPFLTWALHGPTESSTLAISPDRASLLLVAQELRSAFRLSDNPSTPSETPLT